MRRFLLVAIMLFVIPMCFAQSVQEEYIKKYCQIAVDEMSRTGVPASITLAQGILESGSGTSQLAIKGNNHFGIKCHSDWTGGKIYMDDDAKNECFRMYHNASESFRDHSDFLRNNQRYASLFQLDRKDYKGWATGLKKAGYATSPTYATRLIEIIETYNLSQYDSGTFVPAVVQPEANTYTDNSNTASTKPTRYYTSNGFELSMTEYSLGSNNNTQYIVLKYDMDIEVLSRKLGMAPWQLPKYNDLPKKGKVKAGEIIYIKPKRNKAEKKYSVHVVERGETMRDISQKYAVKINKLYKLNGWEQGVQPVEGSKVRLR
ncbi:MAG: glucosaminidase domain-containing protein [Bacteroidales bacterium]|nr:glucosaminidase domain-containing protein [Bacteroidales bacterium]